MTEPKLFGFNLAESVNIEDYPLVFAGHLIMGGNPDTEETGGYWDTEKEAIDKFVSDFAKASAHAQGQFLFVRRAPILEDAVFGHEVKWRMIGRFSIARIKEKKI